MNSKVAKLLVVESDDVLRERIVAVLRDGWGVNLPMRVGAVAMNLATIVVALNAQLLLRVKLGP